MGDKFSPHPSFKLTPWYRNFPMLGGFEGALDWAPMMPKYISLSGSWTFFRFKISLNVLNGS